MNLISLDALEALGVPVELRRTVGWLREIGFDVQLWDGEEPHIGINVEDPSTLVSEARRLDAAIRERTVGMRGDCIRCEWSPTSEGPAEIGVFDLTDACLVWP